MKLPIWILFVLALVGASLRATAQVFNFSTGPVLGNMAMASRPDSSGKFEIETADDFVLSQAATINSATFTGLLVNPVGAIGGPSAISTITGVTVEIIAFSLPTPRRCGFRTCPPARIPPRTTP